MRHLKIILLAIFAICLLQTIAIQAKSVHLYDSRRPLPIDGALIVGKSHDGNTLFKLVSDEDGRFTIADENCTDSPLTLSIRRTGYRDLSFKVESCHKLADTLRMHSDANLNEVVVSQKRPLYTVKPDKFIYDVASDSTARLKNSLEIMENLPMIDVRRNGAISSMTDKRITFKLNGLKDPILGNGVSETLMAIPASALKQIEVKEKNEGDSGDIVEINIITKGRLEGYLGKLVSEAGDSQWRNMLWGLTKIKNLCINGNYAPIWFYGHKRTSDLDEYRYDSDELFNYKEHSYSSGYKCLGHSFELSTSYDIDDASMLSVRGRVIIKPNPHWSDSRTTEIFNRSGKQTAGYTNNTVNHPDDAEYQANVSYQTDHKKSNTPWYFYLGYEFYSRPTTLKEDSEYIIDSGLETAPELIENLYDYERREKQGYVTHTVATNYNITFNNKHTVNVDGQYRYRDESYDNRQTNYYNLAPNPYERLITYNTALKESYAYGNLSYAFTSSRWYATAGGLMQFYNHKITTSDESRNVDRNQLYFSPWASLSYVNSHNTKWQIGYSFRHSVAGLGAMNPYIQRNIAGQIKYGNPDIKAQSAHSIEMTVSGRIKKFNTGLTVGYSYADNMILQHRFLKDGILNITYGNLADRNMMWLSGYTSARISRNTFVRLRAKLEQIRYNAPRLNQKNNGWIFSANGYIEQELPLDLTLEVTGGFNTPWIYLQGKGGRNFNYGLSLYRSFLKRKLSVSASAYSFIPIYYNRRYVTSTDNYTCTTINRGFHASFELTLRYTFGRLNVRVKEPKKSISNDDIKSSYDN